MVKIVNTITQSAKRGAKNVKAVAGSAARKMTVSTRTKHTIVHAAKTGAKRMQAIAGEAAGAAAKAATEVVLNKTGEAIAAGHDTLVRSSPSIQRAAEKTARQSIDKPRRRKRRSARSR